MFFFLFTVLIGLQTGCSAESYSKSADRDVRDMTQARLEEVTEGRGAWVRNSFVPAEPAPLPSWIKRAKHAPEIKGTLNLGITEAAALAFQYNREFQTNKEALYLQGLSLTERRHDFDFIFSAVLSGGINSEDPGKAGTKSFGAGFGISKLLPWGGVFSIEADGDISREPATFGLDPDDISHSISISLRQPLLRGFGNEVAQERLTQAERDLTYAIRQFELQREELVLNLVQKYYSLVRRMEQLSNLENNFKNVSFDRERAEALFKIGKAKEVDVFRARLTELRAQDDIIASRQELDNAKDEFKQFLGIPVETDIELRKNPPAYVDVSVDLRAAVDSALHNRLDFGTAKDRIEDAERAYRVARNRMFPDLTFRMDYDFRSESSDNATRPKFEDRDFDIGLDLEIPLDNLQRRNDLKRALIELDRARRDFDLEKSAITREVSESARNLQRLKNSLDTEDKIRISERKNVEISEIRFKQGTISNRDLVDARGNLLRAENNYIAALVNYEIARVRLLRDLGLLYVNKNGGWSRIGGEEK